MNGLHISLLGQCRAAVDGQALDTFRTSKVQALLIYLLVQTVEGAAEVGREQLMALLWPRMPRKSAQENLRQTLYQLRRALPNAPGPDGEPVPLILGDRQFLRVNPEARYGLDVASFTSLVQEGEPEQLPAAVGLYRGDFLADFYLEDSNEFEEWAAGWRGRLRRQVLEALERLAAHHLERGEGGEAASYARRALEIDNLSESAHRQLMLALSQMGKRTEAIRQYERCRALLREELNVAPSAQTEEAAAAIRRRQWAGRRRTRLPVPETPLIGREKELADLTALLQSGARLVSIVAPGGMGKSRLALEAAHRLAPGADDGRPGTKDAIERVTFVNLAPLSEGEELTPTVARALDLEFEKGNRERLRQRLLDYLQGKNQLLLLDNFEHLLEGATLLKEILRAAPGVKLLVTSRERLKLQAEHVYPINGLAYSEWTTPVEASRDAAVKLFQYHARRVRPAFTLRSEHLAPLRVIVRSTEGMPLALILAATWVQVLSLSEIAEEIGLGLDFLEATHRDVPARQRSIRAVFEATWQRLSEPERALFAAFSVFRGGFTLEAAQAVSGATPGDLMRLADRTLVTRLQGGRFEVHELLRQFGGEKLAEGGQDEVVHDAHSRYFLQALADCLPKLKGRGQLAAVGDIEDEIDNIRAAWRWAVPRGQWSHLAKASESLYLFALFRSRHLDIMDLLDIAYRAIAKSYGSNARVRAYITARWLALSEEIGSLERRSEVVGELQALAETLTDQQAAACCQLVLGDVFRVDGRNSEALKVLDAALAFYQQAGDSFYAALTLWQLGWAKGKSGQGEEALGLLRRGLALAHQAKNPYVMAELLWGVGGMIWKLEGLTEEAERYYKEAAELQREMGAQAAYAYILCQVANMAVWRKGDMANARPMLDEALAIAEEQNVTYVIAHVLAEMTTLRLIDGRYEEALALTDEVLASAARHLNTWTWASFQQAIAYLGLGQLEEAVEAMMLPLSRMIDEDWTGMLRTLVAFAGVILAELGQEERAAELLALGLTDPYTPGRLEVDPLITRYREKLEAALGQERFAAAWERGKQLDTLAAAAGVLEELEASD